MSRAVYVTCPSCSKDFYVYGKDYVGHPEAPCHCPFCSTDFQYGKGKPRES